MTSTRVVGVFLGGCSSEHEASIHSAVALFDTIETLEEEIIWIYMLPTGLLTVLGRGPDVKDFMENQSRHAANPDLPEYKMELSYKSMRLIPSLNGQPRYSIDVALPLFHGGAGEDGSFQGLCKMFAIPCVGPTVLGAAISLDKAICKSIIRDHDIAITKHMLVDIDNADPDAIIRELGNAMIIKPRSEGSSVGVSFVSGPAELRAALSSVRQFGPQCLIEEYVKAVEAHCYVLRTQSNTKVSRVSGSVPPGKFHSYEEKLYTPHTVKRLLAKDFPPEVAERIRSDAHRVFTVLEGYGVARLDFFLLNDGKILFNEINAIPGGLGPVTGVNPWQDYEMTLRDVLVELIESSFESCST
jgi:D-alanine-D-alanine ligase